MGVIADKMAELIDQLAESVKKDEEHLAHIRSLIKETEEAMAECQREMDHELML